MKIADGIETLELKALNLTGAWSIINPVVIHDPEGAILVDAGYPGHLAALTEHLGAAQVPLSRLRQVIITHHDLDHIGSLAALKSARNGELQVLAHAGEVPYIQGELPPVKQTPERRAEREALFNALPDDVKPLVKGILSPPAPTVVDRIVADGEELPHGGGVVVIHTPGHSPGHICLYHKRSRSLIAGDALNVVEGRLTGPNPAYTPDFSAALASLAKLADFDIETVLCYHGGIYRDDANRRIAELAGGRE